MADFAHRIVIARGVLSDGKMEYAKLLGKQFV